MLLEIQQSLTCLKHLTDLAKNANDAAEVSKNADLVRTIAQLNLEAAKLEQLLATAIRRATELEDENCQIRKRITELERQPVAEEKLSIGRYGYYTDSKDGPFCTTCYDVKKLRVRLDQLGPLRVCGNCGKQTTK